MRALVQHILGLVSHPILNFLYRWIYDGELEDTYHEVRQGGTSDLNERVSGHLRSAVLFDPNEVGEK